MNALQTLLQAMDHAWDHPFESLDYILYGLDEEEALWRAQAWQAEPREEGFPPPGTILFHLVHLAHCKGFYAQVLRQLPAKPQDPTPPQAETLAQALAVLEDAHTELRAALAELAPESVTAKIFNGKTVSEFVHGTVRHDAWHGGQIAVLRRLYRTRD